MSVKTTEPVPGDCEICGQPLPPRAGPGRPRKRHTACQRPSHVATHRPDPVGVTMPAPVRRGVAHFGPRGDALWRDMVELLPGPLHRDLLTEACRIADRCDRMDALLRGERRSWAALQLGDIAGDGVLDVRVVVSSIVSEARNSATALKAIVAELRQAMREAGGGGANAEVPVDAVDGLLGEIAAEDELAARRRSHGSAL